MTYLLSNIIIFILLAGSIGTIAGWFLGKTSANKKLQASYQALLHDNDSVTSQLAEYRHKIARQDITIQRLTSSYTLKERDNRTLAKSFINFQKKHKTLQTDIENLRSELTTLKKDNSHLRIKLALKEKTLKQNEEDENKNADQNNDDNNSRDNSRDNNSDKHIATSRGTSKTSRKKSPLPDTHSKVDELAQKAKTPLLIKAAKINLLRPYEARDTSHKTHSGPDDLTLIRGIGKVNERILHEEGITTFAQIAAFSPEDVKSYGKKLGAFHERISQERWVEQAKELHRQKYEQ